MKKSYSIPILILLVIFITIFSASAEGVISTSIPASASPYSSNFDLRNMVGINDNTITADPIEAFIREKTPNSSMLNEAVIGNCFIDAGIDNNASQAFLSNCLFRVGFECVQGFFAQT